MKKKFTFNDFKKNEIANEKVLQINGGKTRIRRPSRTFTSTIWDDLEIRKDEKPASLLPDLTIRFNRR